MSGRPAMYPIDHRPNFKHTTTGEQILSPRLMSIPRVLCRKWDTQRCIQDKSIEKQFRQSFPKQTANCTFVQNHQYRQV